MCSGTISTVPTWSIPTGTFYSFQQTSEGGFIAAGSTNEFNSGDSSIWLVKTDSNGNIASCTDVHNDSAATGSIAVTVSKGGPIGC